MRFDKPYYEAPEGSSVVSDAFRHVGILSPIVTNRGFTCEDGTNVDCGNAWDTSQHPRPPVCYALGAEIRKVAHGTRSSSSAS